MINQLKEEKNKLEYIKFLASNGIILPNFETILELNTNARQAIATDTESYEQFLLSEKIEYLELYNAKLKGGNGYIDEQSLIIPKSLDSDAYFFGYGKPYTQCKSYSYIYPRYLKEFELVMSSNISPTDKLGEAIAKGNIKNFVIGSVIDNERQSLVTDFNRTAQYLHKYGISFDEDFAVDGDRQFYLVKSKGIK